MRLTSSFTYLLPALVGGCGSAPEPLQPLGPPDPGAEPIELVWHMGTETRVTTEMRLELRPGGRFRYAWRTLGDEAASWREIVGTWRRRTARSAEWVLEPDGGRALLEPGQFDELGWPVLKWSGTLTGDGGEDVPFAGTAMYLIPALDSRTGRFRNLFGLQEDPRERARREALVRGG